mmetsp:Transcript_177836/g.570326  ORF Transcript_177836/g.570326 Transcript_177836/m.570326 type:complete len:202 (+) Transcript_177836:1272-1877(+)
MHLLVGMGDALLQSRNQALQDDRARVVRDRRPPPLQSGQQHLQQPQTRRLRVRGGLAVLPHDGRGQHGARRHVPARIRQKGGQPPDGDVLRRGLRAGPEAPGHADDDIVNQELPIPDVDLLREFELLSGNGRQGRPELVLPRLRPAPRGAQRAAKCLEEDDVVLGLALRLGLQARQQGLHLLDEVGVATLSAEGDVRLEKG